MSEAKESQVGQGKHTPGPWTIQSVNNRCETLIWQGDARRVVGSAIGENHPANAALIAAAPELLEALKATTAILQGWEGTLTQRAGDCVPAAITAATAAIAKAEGR